MFEVLVPNSASSPPQRKISTEPCNPEHTTPRMASTERKIAVPNNNGPKKALPEAPSHTATLYHYQDLSPTCYVPSNTITITLTEENASTLVQPSDKTRIWPHLLSKRHVNLDNSTNANANANAYDIELCPLPNSTLTTQCYSSQPFFSAAKSLQRRRRTRKILRHVMLALAGMVVGLVVTCAVVYVVATLRFSRGY
ncbi:hypothetical protein G6011_10282 [Alternaria panax]|uniref:Uncharacterized protein n=1 Tax=Alternaria panax TaxID=48097 RepID=A0AAD4IBM5_9PLEO|nr:hypothetical protein G6011_10282 [Alternaria panax]